MLGDGKKYIVALIVPSFETLKEWAAKEGLNGLGNEQLVSDEKVIRKYEEIINELNQHFGRVEQVKKFKLMPQELTEESGELTPTLKLKRKVIMSKYQQEIESLYVE